MPETTCLILHRKSANDFARGCGLPSDDLTECLGNFWAFFDAHCHTAIETYDQS